jgi:predicted nucleotidyltransferase
VRGRTGFADLDDVLSELVAGVEAALGDQLVGVYLQGSFAVGDADEHSDVDFLVVIERPLRNDEVERLRHLHRRLYALASPWAQHLEGSYTPRDVLRAPEDARTPLLYLDNGAVELVWDTHCNTAVVRWSLREHGVTLVGPEPPELIEPITAEALRAEVREALHEWRAWAPEPTRTGGMSRWKQALLVLSFCRMLHTLKHGIVVSKRKAAEWALEALEPEWHPLIRHSLAERPDPWVKVGEPAAAEVARETLAFADYAVAVSRMRPR